MRDRGHAREQRTEHDQQHDDRDEDADPLALPDVLLGDLLEVLRRRGLPERVHAAWHRWCTARGSSSRSIDVRRRLIRVARQDHGEQHRACRPRTGSDRAQRPADRCCWSSGSGNCDGTVVTASAPKRAQVVQRRVHRLGERRILHGAVATGHHERLGRQVLLEVARREELRGALGLGVVREVEVRGQHRTEQRGRPATIPATRIAPQMPTVRHGWRLLPRASDSGLIFMVMPPSLPPERLDVRCMLTMYGG